NKSTDVNLADATNTLFPTETAVKTYVDTQIATAGSTNLSTTDLTQTANRTYDLDENDLSFDITNSDVTFIGTGGNVGIGNAANPPTNKLHVAGAIRSQGFLNSNGATDGSEPSYRFNDDTDTGMYRGNLANYLRFSTAGNEAMTIDPSQNVGVGTTAPNSTLHTGGSFATAINRLSGTFSLDETHHTIIIIGDSNITLPDAATSIGRIYIIKNPDTSAIGDSPDYTTTISTFLDDNGDSSTSLLYGVTQLQSDGINWQQINQR
ncbi:hypothetical protein R3X28_19130, partial [Maribacter sp. TH_r10]|nr:hypothetical protein [Maribacter sp. TH_r10]